MSSGRGPRERTVAAWARTRPPRPSLLRGLGADARGIAVALGWRGPRGPLPGDSDPGGTRMPSASPGWPWSRIAIRRPGIQVDGPPPARLPDGPVILVANHPTISTAGLILSRLDPARRSRTVVVATPLEAVPIRSRLLRRVVRVDPEAPPTSRDRLVGLLARGWSVLAFPEGPPAAGAVRRRHHAFAADLARRSGVPVMPVGIRGARAIGASPGPARVSVRFGEPLPTGADARDQQRAIAALIAEDGATWWAVRRAGPGQLPGPRTPEDAHRWRHVWAQTARPRPGGRSETPKIWR